jgi:hypothetical protein
MHLVGKREALGVVGGKTGQGASADIIDATLTSSARSMSSLIDGAPVSTLQLSSGDGSMSSNTSWSSRRVFIAQVVAGGGAVIALGAKAQTMVDEKDAQAAALGYVADTTKADAKKYPKHTNDQKCSTCQLYTGKAADKSGPCSLFAGKHVAGNGWCSAWVKKPA